MDRAPYKAFIGPVTKDLYFIQVGETGPIKIGVAMNAHKRCAHLQIAHHDRLFLRGVIPEGEALEPEFHQKYAKTHRRGEWFEFDPLLANEIKGLPDQPEPITVSPISASPAKRPVQRQRPQEPDTKQIDRLTSDNRRLTEERDALHKEVADLQMQASDLRYQATMVRIGGHSNGSVWPRAWSPAWSLFWIVVLAGGIVTAVRL